MARAAHLLLLAECGDLVDGHGREGRGGEATSRRTRCLHPPRRRAAGRSAAARVVRVPWCPSRGDDASPCRRIVCRHGRHDLIHLLGLVLRLDLLHHSLRRVRVPHLGRVRVGVRVRVRARARVRARVWARAGVRARARVRVCRTLVYYCYYYYHYYCRTLVVSLAASALRLDVTWENLVSSRREPSLGSCRGVMVGLGLGAGVGLGRGSGSA